MKANNLQRQGGVPAHPLPLSPSLHPCWGRWCRWNYSWQTNKQPGAELLQSLGKLTVNRNLKLMLFYIRSHFCAVAMQRDESKRWFTWLFLCDHLLLFRDVRLCETLELLFCAKLDDSEEQPADPCLLLNRKIWRNLYIYLVYMSHTIWGNEIIESYFSIIESHVQATVMVSEKPFKFKN